MLDLETLNLWGKSVLTGLLSAVMVVIVTALNPWGLNGVSSKAAQDAIQRLTVDAYPIAHPAKRGEQITVITIDEAGVEALADAGWEGWPPGLDNLGLMIGDVVRNSGPMPGEPGFRGARAVFADFWVDGPPGARPGERLAEDGPVGPDGPRLNARGQALQRFDQFLMEMGALTRSKAWADVPECRTDAAMKIACIVAAGGVPVIMARPTDASRQAAIPVQASATNEARLQREVVLASVKIDEMTSALIEPSADGGGFSLSPPAALWLAACLGEVERGGDCPELVGAGAFLQRAHVAISNAGGRGAVRKVPPLNPQAALRRLWPEPMTVIWGGREAAEQGRLQRQTSSTPPPACRSSASPLTRLTETFLGRMSDRGDQRACLPHRRMEYDRLVSGLGLPQRDYDLLLRDRIVLIGSHFDSADWISTPVHGRVPGVHWHAMATDNLLSFGPDYRRADAGLWSWGTLWEALITFGVTTLTAVLVGLTRRAVEAGGKPKPWLIVAAGSAVCLLAIVLILWLLNVWWHTAPINWIAVLGVCVVAAASLIEEATAGRVGPYLGRRVRDPLIKLGAAAFPRRPRTPDTAPGDAPAAAIPSTQETP